MSAYSFGIILALAASLLHAGANLVDGVLVKGEQKSLSHLIFCYSLINALFLPLIWLVSRPAMLGLQLLPMVAAIALIEVLYQYPYFSALRQEEASVVASLFSLGKISTPLIAFLVVGERLNILNYAGFGLIAVSCAALTFDYSQLQPKQSWWLMLLVTICLSFQTVLYKYSFMQGVGWGTLIVWSTIFELAISTGIILFTPKSDLSLGVYKLPLLVVIGQVLTWMGSLAGVYAVLAIPVSVSTGLQELQAIFVLAIGFLFFHENSLKRAPRWRSLLFKFSLMLAASGGAWLVAVKG